MMVVDAEILGYIECNTCNEPKAIKQGKGKRSRFVHGRCLCGPDPRTGAKAQLELKAFKPLDMVKAAIAARLATPIKPNKPNNEQSKPNNEPNTNVIEAKPEPNTDMQSEPNNNPDSDSLNISKCVGLGSIIGLVFGLIIR